MEKRNIKLVLGIVITFSVILFILITLLMNPSVIDMMIPKGNFYEEITPVFSTGYTREDGVSGSPKRTAVFTINFLENLSIQNINTGEYDKKWIYFFDGNNASKEIKGLNGH